MTNRPRSPVIAPLLAALTVAACSGERNAVSPGVTADSADEVIFGLRQYLTRYGVQQAYVRADSGIRYEAAGRVDLKKVTVIFYSTVGAQTSVLTARTGVYWLRTGQMSASGDVLVVRTSDGAQLRTDYLRYDPQAGRVSTDRHYLADKGIQHFEGEGFECDPGFTNCTTQHVHGQAGRLVMPKQ